MMRPKQLSYAPRTAALNNVALDQTTAGAANLTLNGSLVTGGVAYLHTAKAWIGYRLDLESTGNISAVNFTITGTDENGAAQSETIAGPNNNTVTTTAYWRTVTQIAVDGAVGTNTSVGTTDEFVTATLPVDMYDAGHSVSVIVTGTIDYDLQRAMERVTATPQRLPNWLDGRITGATFNAQAEFLTPTGAFRLKVNSFSAGATAKVNINQAATFSA